MRLNRKNYKIDRQYPEKILQFGEGNFLRAFVDWQVERMNERTDFGGSVVVVQPIQQGLVELLNEQDGLYTLYLQGMKDGEAVKEHEVVSSISRGINPYTDYPEYLKLAHNPELRFIVSNTTEAGIVFEEGDELRDSPQSTFPGKLTAFLYERYRAFSGNPEKGFILLPCELIDQNGRMLRQAVLQYAKHWALEPEFVTWIDEANVFCSTLVDRIVPGYPKDTIEEITKELGYEDRLVNVAEYFHLWVIEGPAWLEEEFPAGRAGLNVKFVDDLAPYRTRKVRILNGAHTAVVPVAYLCGIDTVGEAMEHSLMGKFIRRLIEDEILPTLELPREELNYYASVVLDRFRNPFVKHYLVSIALNSISKFETRDLPSLLSYYQKKGRLPKYLVFSLAALIKFYKGRRGEQRIPLNDDAQILVFLNRLWDECDGSEEALKSVVYQVLGTQKYWKQNLTEVAGLADAVAEHLIHIESVGMLKAVEELLGEG